jgi:hypothetical protein
MSEQDIIEGITKRAFSIWTVGITDDRKSRAREHEADGHSITHFRYWDAVNEAAARKIEKYFLDRGMKGHSGGGKNPHFVYVF